MAPCSHTPRPTGKARCRCGRRIRSRGSLGLLEARDAKPVEEPMRPPKLRDPLDIGVEISHQRLHVDAVRSRTVVVERDERLLHEIERAAGGATSGAQVEPARELHEALEE